MSAIAGRILPSYVLAKQIKPSFVGFVRKIPDCKEKPRHGLTARAGDGQDIYSQPDVYEMAFGYRRIDEEVDFLMDVNKSHSDANRKPATVLDVGCGAGQHSVELAKRGVKVHGIDINDKMLEYTEERASEERVEIQLSKADMRNFDLGKTFDVVIAMLGTLMHLCDIDDAVSAFQSISRHMKPGGLLVIEMAHPGDMFDGSMIDPEILGSERWCQTEGFTAPGITSLEVQWGSRDDNFDPETQIIRRAVTVIAEGGRSFRRSSVVSQRHYTVGECRLLARLAGIKVIGIYGEANVRTGLFDEEAYRMFVVFQKPQ